MNSTNSSTKVNENKKTKLNQKIISLLSNPPTSLGYEAEIKYILEDLDITQEDYLRIWIVFLSRKNRTPDELKLIIGYFFFMKGIIKLVKDNEANIIDYLHTIAKNVNYEKMECNRVWMRYGEKGRKAYILLQGEIKIWVQEDKIMKITEQNYYYYLATWIYYKEYQIIENVLNDNYPRFPLEIIDDITPFIDDDEDDNNNQKKLSDSQMDNVIIEEEDEEKHNTIQTSSNSEKELKSKKNNSFWKLNTKNLYLKDRLKEIRVFKATELLQLFPNISSDSNPNNIRFNHYNNTTSRKSEKEILNGVTVDEYIERWNVCKNVVKGEIKPKNDDIVVELNILNYKVVAKLPAGVLVGEVAWNESNKRRNATIITTQDSHFGTWNKKSYSASLKAFTEKQWRNNLNFILSFKVFSGITFGALSEKFKNFNIIKSKKGIMLYNQGERPKYIYLLRQGIFEVTMKITWKDWTEYIKYCYKILEQPKKLEQYDISSKRSLQSFKDNFQFIKFYNSKEVIRINEIQCPDIVGLVDFINENGEIGFNVECKSPTSEIFQLNINYYNQLREKDITVKSNEEVYIRQKMEILLERLSIIRESKIKTFFDYKGEYNKINKMLSMGIAAENMKKMQMNRRFETGKTIWDVKDKEYFVQTTPNYVVKEKTFIVAEDYIKQTNRKNKYSRYCLSDTESTEKKKRNINNSQRNSIGDNINSKRNGSNNNNNNNNLSQRDTYLSPLENAEITKTKETRNINSKIPILTLYEKGNGHFDSNNNKHSRNVVLTNEFLNNKCMSILNNNSYNIVNPISLNNRHTGKHRLNNKYSISREQNYFTDLQTEENMKEINTLLLDVENYSTSLDGANSCTGRYQTMSNFQKNLKRNLAPEITSLLNYNNTTRKQKRNISSVQIKRTQHSQHNKQYSEIALNDMVWENVQPKVKAPLFTRWNHYDYWRSSRNQREKNMKETSSKINTNINTLSNINIDSFGKTGFSNPQSKNYRWTSKNKKITSLRDSTNVIRMNTNGNKAIDIKEYNELKKQKYNDERKVYLNKTMKRFNSQYRNYTNKKSNK